MGISLSTPIATARTILNDPDAVRYSASDMLAYANDAVRMMVPLLPHLFQSVGDVTCDGNNTMQAVRTDVALAITDVRRVKNGGAILPMDAEALSQFDPSWRNSPTGAAISWSRVASDPLRFEIYPPAPPGQVIEVMYLRIPVEYTASADTVLPEVYSGAIADYVVYRAESRDDEHVNANRAAQFLASFVAKVKGV